MPKVPDAHLEARKRSILEAASRVFCQEGTQDATMAAVAREAGISPGAIYRYFDSKDELARACFAGGSDTVQAHWLEMESFLGDPMESLNALSREAFAMMKGPEESTHTILALEHVLELARAGDAAGLLAATAERSAVEAGVRARLQAAQDNGCLPPMVSPGALAGALMSFYWGARLARLADPATDTDAQAAAVMQLIDLVTRGRGPSAES
ncbi:MAG: TetR/AcrR family transcriptional regulator [Tepidiformaceae bacterium]